MQNTTLTAETIIANARRHASEEDAKALSNDEELRRQEAFLDLAKDQTRQLAELLGRTPTYCVVNFGCQMNAKDAEKLCGVLKEAGYEESDREDADFVVYNTCTVRDNADQHFYGRLGRAAHFRKSHPYMKIAVCGCMMQEPACVEKVKKSYPYVNLVFGTHNLFRFPEYLADVYENQNGDFDPRGRKLYVVWKDTKEIVEDLPAERKYPYKSGVNIMFGCDNFCTYCIVPYVRGRERSRKPTDIIREVERLVADGVVEVMLLGQNVNSYGHDLTPEVSFAELLAAVAEVPGVKRVRWMTPHPKDMGEDVIQVIASHPNIARHIHLPLQSGSTKILKRMNRRYTKEQYLDLAMRIREELPDCAITTDLIAGFPGETPEDVDETLDVINTVHFDNAYTFIYSKRTGTPAAKMEQVPDDQVKAGFDRVLAAVQENARERTALLAGSVQTALCEEMNPQEPGYVTLRLSNNTLVHVPGDASMIGRFYDVRLDTCRGFYYFGTVCGENKRGY